MDLFAEIVHGFYPAFLKVHYFDKKFSSYIFNRFLNTATWLMQELVTEAAS